MKHVFCVLTSEQMLVAAIKRKSEGGKAVGAGSGAAAGKMQTPASLKVSDAHFLSRKTSWDVPETSSN